jgi:hypothetical protein
MRSPFVQFLVGLSVYTAILVLITVVVFALLPAGYASEALPFQFVLYYAVTLTVHYLLLRASEKGAGSFVTRFMLVSFLKLLLYIIVLVAYLYLNRSDALRFAIPYLGLYILYSVFEIYSITRYSKTYKSTQQKNGK